MYIDTDTGTVLNGPIVWVDDAHDFEDISDSEALSLADEFGEPVGRLVF